MNDVVATGPDSFYATNLDYLRRGMTKQMLEFVLDLHWGSVVFYDGQSGREVVSGLHHPNGISISPDLK